MTLFVSTCSCLTSGSLLCIKFHGIDGQCRTALWEWRGWSTHKNLWKHIKNTLKASYNNVQNTLFNRQLREEFYSAKKTSWCLNEGTLLSVLSRRPLLNLQKLSIVAWVKLQHCILYKTWMTCMMLYWFYQM